MRSGRMEPSKERFHESMDPVAHERFLLLTEADDREAEIVISLTEPEVTRSFVFSSGL
jgi:hypothetical protein